jgi:hypothetical protein
MLKLDIQISLSILLTNYMSSFNRSSKLPIPFYKIGP